MGNQEESCAKSGDGIDLDNMLPSLIFSNSTSLMGKLPQGGKLSSLFHHLRKRPTYILSSEEGKKYIAGSSPKLTARFEWTFHILGDAHMRKECFILKEQWIHKIKMHRGYLLTDVRQTLIYLEMGRF